MLNCVESCNMEVVAEIKRKKLSGKLGISPSNPITVLS